MQTQVVLKPKLVDRSAFGQIFKVPAPAGVADVYHVVPSEGHIIKFWNDRGTLCTMKDVYVSHLYSARKLIGKSQTGKVGMDSKIVIPASHVVSFMKGEK